MPTTQVKLQEGAWVEVVATAASAFNAQLSDEVAGKEARFQFAASLPAPAVPAEEGFRLRQGDSVQRAWGTGALYGRGGGTVTVTT